MGDAAKVSRSLRREDDCLRAELKMEFYTKIRSRGGQRGWEDIVDTMVMMILHCLGDSELFGACVDATMAD